MKATLYKKFNEGMELRGFANQSKETYVRLVKKLSEHYLRSPDEITDDELNQYILYLLREKKYARSTMIAVVCALRTFYRITCNRSTESLQNVLPLMKAQIALPRLYGKEEIQRLLSVEGIRLKQRTMLITAYAAGLRVSEVCRLKVTDIMSSRMQIRIEQGKGWKDRYTVLSPKLLNILRNYWRIYRPPLWLFPTPCDVNKPINPRSLHRTFKYAVEKAGLPDRGGIHSLRHSFATHIYEGGVELPTLQSLLGHRWLTSTMVYLHVSQHRLAEARSPLDQINIGPAPVQIKRAGETPLYQKQETEHEIWCEEEPD
jgi:site-specific recombinase XerD